MFPFVPCIGCIIILDDSLFVDFEFQFKMHHHIR